MDSYRGFGGWYRMAAAAHHQLGEHRGELAVARAGRTAHPDLVAALHTEAVALAALGRADEAMRVARETLRLPRLPRYAPGRLLADVAEELAAHGAPAAARTLATEAVAWLERPNAPDPSGAPVPPLVYQLAGRPADAWRSAQARLATTPSEPSALGDVGVLAAWRGDTVAAWRADSALRAPRPHALGTPAFERARIAAALGREDDPQRRVGVRKLTARSPTWPGSPRPPAGG